jgi:hypothetical protein
MKNQIADKLIYLYKNKVRIEFFERYHQYFLIGKNGDREKLKSVTSATSVIDKSGALIGWAIKLSRVFLTEKLESGEIITMEDVELSHKLHAQKKKEAADLGTAVHAWVEEYIKAKLGRRSKPKLPEDEKILNGVIAFLKWEKEHKVKFLASELIVYSKKHNYVGLMDAKAVIDQKLSCVDFKTSNGIYDEMRFQVAAYRQADSEEAKEKYQSTWIVRFGKNDGEFEAHEIPDHKKDFEAFLNCLGLRRRLDELKQNWKNNQ